jgi:probable rRNA maturation factor
MSQIEVQVAVSGTGVPARRQFETWATAAVGDRLREWELCIRIVGTRESAELNERYRGRTGATNVLSFAADLPPVTGIPLLGDIVICLPLVGAEARAQAKPVIAHWAHLTVHGVLHLLGMDHEDPNDAEQMEAEEKRVLSHLGYPDPYTVTASATGNT